jgi:hypothetical protein
MMKKTINFPKELLFISRNMNLVRSLNKYHGGVADRISILAKAAYIGSSMDNNASNKYFIFRNDQIIHLFFLLLFIQFKNMVIVNSQLAY